MVESTRAKVSIAANPTVSPADQRAQPADPEASLRAEFIARILAAQSDLATALAQLSPTADSALRAQVSAQLQSLAGLERAISSGNPATLAAMRNEITAAVAASAGVSQQARDDAQRIDAAQLAAASTASRDQVTAAMRDMHRFDPYLRFASPEDEEAYRHREADRRAYIEEQQARGTPQGDLNAHAATLGQLNDAESYGAANSPDFQARKTALTESYDRLRSEIQRNGGSTREADARLAQDVRQTLRRRGLTDQEIDARFEAQGGDPLKVMQAETVPPSAQAATARAQPVSPSIAAQPPQPNDLQDAMAALRAAGVIAAPPIAEIAIAASTPQISSRGTAAGRG